MVQQINIRKVYSILYVLYDLQNIVVCTKLLAKCKCSAVKALFNTNLHFC
jgi:hypothetical protein